MDKGIFFLLITSLTAVYFFSTQPTQAGIQGTASSQQSISAPQPPSARNQGQRVEEVEEEIEQVEEEDNQVVVEVEEEVEAKTKPRPLFDMKKAVRDTMDILMSVESRRIVNRCFEGFEAPAPPSISIIVDIDPKGVIRSLNIVEEIPEKIVKCIEGGMQLLHFISSPEGISVGVTIPVEKKEARAPTAPQPARSLKRQDPAANFIFYNNTAYPVDKGSYVIRFVNAGNLVLSIGLKDNIDLTISTIPPITVWGVGIFPKFSFKVSKHIHTAIIPGLGGEIEYLGPGGTLIYGVRNVWSFGNKKNFVDLSIHVGGLSIFTLGDHMMTITPGLLGSVQVGKRVRLSVRAMVPLLAFYSYSYDSSIFYDFDQLSGVNTINGKIWLLSYGIRIFGKKVFGDINFLYTIYPGWWEFQIFCPMGWPSFAVGFKI